MTCPSSTSAKAWPPSWPGCHVAYRAITEETPYAFGKPEQLTEPSTLASTCRPNRGPDRAPMFLLNHWVTTDPVPLPSHADKVNAYRLFLRRLKECRRVRGHLHNLVAVNFYRRGDLARVVDALNGVGWDRHHAARRDNGTPRCGRMSDHACARSCRSPAS